MPNTVIVGGSLAGLATALLLARDGHEVVVVEQDHGDRRPHTPQLRQSHTFLPLFRHTFATRFPDVHRALPLNGAADVRQPAPDALTEQGSDPGEEALVFFACRRTEVDRALREAVDAEPGVRLLTAKVDDLSRANGRVRGVVTGRETLSADLVVDARGRRIAERGPAIVNESCRIVYASRFYRSVDGGSPAPLEHGFGSGGSLPGWSCQLFAQDGRHFVIVIGVLPEDEEMRAVRHEREFEAALSAVPSIAPWREAGRSEPVSPVVPIAGMRNMLADDSSDPSGYVRIGDAMATTDPAFGRGAAIALWQATVLADTLRGYDPAGPESTNTAIAEYRKAIRSPVAGWVDNALWQTGRRTLRWRRALGPDQGPTGGRGSTPTRPYGLSTVMAAAAADRVVWTAVQRCTALLDPFDILLRADIQDRVGLLMADGWRSPERAQPTRSDALARMGSRRETSDDSPQIDRG